MAWTFGFSTDIGGRSEQQDRVAILHAPDGQRHLLVVADGMGGLQDGALAAQTLVDIAIQRFEQAPGDSAFDLLQDICLGAHAAIAELPTDSGAAPGTTAILLYLDQRNAAWMHVGDSRLYHFRNGHLENRTNDHSMLQLMVYQGLVKANSREAATLQNQLYMRLGGEKIPEPDFNSCQLEDGDAFILCSDGLWQSVDPGDMLAALNRHSQDQNAPRYLTDLAVLRSGNGCDNVSVAICLWHESNSGLWQRLRKVLARKS